MWGTACFCGHDPQSIFAAAAARGHEPDESNHSGDLFDSAPGDASLQPPGMPVSYARGNRTSAKSPGACVGAGAAARWDVQLLHVENLGGYGDGGMMVTQDAGPSERRRRLGFKAVSRPTFPDEVGYNRADARRAAGLSRSGRLES